MDLATAAFAAKITDKVTDGLVTAGTKRVKAFVLGDPELAALHAAVRSSADQAVSAYPAIGAISAEVDLFADEDVVEEVARASSVGNAGEWPAARARWESTYGTTPPYELDLFLAELVAALVPRLRANEHLRKLHTIWALDAHTERLSAISSTVAGTDQKVTALTDQIQGLVDPTRAIRGVGPGLSEDVAKVSEILAELGLQIRSGTLGKFDLAVTFGKESADIQLRPREGVQAESHIRMVVPDTDEGREQLDAVRQALERGERVELPDPRVTLLADGQPLELPAGIRMFAGPVVERHHATLTFLSEGLEPLRFMATLDVSFGANEIQAESVANTIDPLLVKLVAHPDGTMTGSFRGNDRLRTVGGQIKANELRRRMGQGGTLEFWIAEKDAFASMSFSADPTISGADDAVEILRLFQEIQTALNIEVGEVTGLTFNDVTWLRNAKLLLAGEEVRLSSEGQVFTVRNDTNVAETMAPTDGDSGRTMIWLSEAEWTLPLSRQPLPFGPVTFRSVVTWPPRVNRDGDLYVVSFECDPAEEIVLTRGMPEVANREDDAG